MARAQRLPHQRTPRPRIPRRYTRPYSPWTNGKAEALIKTLLREWAYRFSTAGVRPASRLGIVLPAHDEAAPQADRARPSPGRDPRRDWRERPKNLSGRALAQASGRVRVGNRAGSVQQWVELELALVDDLLEQGWTLA